MNKVKSWLATINRFNGRHSNLLDSRNCCHQLSRWKSSATKDWVGLEELMTRHGAVNLAQGCSDFNPDNDLLENLAKVSKDPSSPMLHQYTRDKGHPRLVEAVARMYSGQMERHLDPWKEVLVTIGATQGIFCFLASQVKKGDQILIVSPSYDSYETFVRNAGGVPVFVPLTRQVGNLSPSSSFASSLSSSADFTFDREEMKAKFKNLKFFILNNPNNPLGKVYTRCELEFLSELCLKHDVIVLSDEVYERLVWPTRSHISIATIPGMWERTVTISSAGKCFSVTGWKIGWSIGPEHLIRKLGEVHEDSIFSAPTPLQEAVAMALEKEHEIWGHDRSYFKRVPIIVQEKVETVAEMVRSVGMKPIMPEGGYFLYVDTSELDFKHSPDGKSTRDVQLAEWIITTKGIGLLPSNFFHPHFDKRLCSDFLRLCCFKSETTLNKAKVQFQKWKNETNS